MEVVIGMLFDCDLFIDNSLKPVFISKIHEACVTNDLETLYIIFAMHIFTLPEFLTKNDMDRFFQSQDYDFINIFQRIYQISKVNDLLPHLQDIVVCPIADFFHQLKYDFPDVYDLAKRMISD